MSDGSGDLDPFEVVAASFVARYRAGERPSVEEYALRHPELASQIRELLPAVLLVEKELSLAGPSRIAHVLTPPDPGRTPRQIGDYRILREIGRGGMGVVYEAEQVSLGRHVALKALPPRMLRDPRQRRRFAREAKAAAKLHHTNIVPVFGVGEHEGTPYYVMQFIQGLGLDDVLDEVKRLRAGAGDDGGRADGLTRAGRDDVSVADVARSLLTGRFEPGLVGSDRDTGPGNSRTATFDGPPPTWPDHS